MGFSSPAHGVGLAKNSPMFITRSSSEHIGLPKVKAPSHHILKPAITGVEGSVFKEGFSLALADEMKFYVAKAHIQRVHDRLQIPFHRSPGTALGKICT
jgi:hypothetical protein